VTPDQVGILIPFGQALLVGSFAFVLIQCLRDDEELSVAFEGLALGLIWIVFYRTGAQILSNLSESMTAFLERHGGGASLMGQLSTALKTAQEDKRVSQEALSYINALKGGVWGVLISISQFLFICAEGVFRLAQKVFWQLLLVLFPIAAGLFPVFPSMLKSLVLYAVELSLWMPVLYLINYCAALAASSPEIAQSPFGLGVVITQILAIFLIINVPSVTHRFMSGAYNHLLGAGGSAYQKTKAVGSWAVGLARPADQTTAAKTIIINQTSAGMKS